VFLDRDGTICEEMGYLNHINRLCMFPYAPEAIRLLNKRDIPVVVITNQSGVARGMFPEALVHEVHKRMTGQLAEAAARVDGFYFCPHRAEDECECRKPRPRLLERAAEEHSLDLSHSFVVGDRYADVEMAHRAGARGVLVLTGYGRGELQWHGKEWPRQPEFIAEDLSVAVGWILREMR
jgi:D-glycero-D-manno-heptose 1,7-bisphosphate phosphatase